MRQKKLINPIIIAIIVVSLFSCAIIIIPIVLFIFYPYPKSVIKNYYNYMLQQDDSTYEYLSILIVNVNYIDEINRVVSIKPNVNEEQYDKMYGQSESYNENNPYNYSASILEICKNNYIILNENGFFDDISAETYVTVITHPSTLATGTGYPLVGVQIGDKVYLDFETGKNNWLEYIRKCIDNPRLYGNE